MYLNVNTKKHKMKKVNISLTLEKEDLPKRLTVIGDPPKKLFIKGADIRKLVKLPTLAIVGSRRVSAYGKHVTERLVGELAADGVVIVSGLALGLDAIVHQATLDAKGTTIAVLPGGIDRVYPRTNVPLARAIVASGGSLVSESSGEMSPQKFNFLIRNRLISALADGVLITEAAIRSGSLNTARHALEQGRTVFAVPGNITSELSGGTNNLIKLGATPVTCVQDIYDSLGWEPTKKKTSDVTAYTPAEQAILKILKKHDSISSEELLALSKLPNSEFFETMTMLEIAGTIKALGANLWSLR